MGAIASDALAARPAAAGRREIARVTRTSVISGSLGPAFRQCNDLDAL